jgi:hypothetical protein
MRSEVENERANLKERHIEIELDFSCKEQRMIKDTEEYLMRIQSLEDENSDLISRLKKINDK